jgi:hypothetical protein
MNFLIIDTDGKVAGDRFIAVPPAVQEAIKLRLLHTQPIIINGVETKVFPLGYSNNTLGSDVARMNGNEIELLKR